MWRRVEFFTVSLSLAIVCAATLTGCGDSTNNEGELYAKTVTINGQSFQTCASGLGRSCPLLGDYQCCYFLTQSSFPNVGICTEKDQDGTYAGACLPVPPGTDIFYCRNQSVGQGGTWNNLPIVGFYNTPDYCLPNHPPPSG